jgi:predicted metallopeptidase
MNMLRYAEYNRLKNKIKIKLVIAEIAHTQFKKTLRSMVSPILCKINMSPEFGLFHSALQIVTGRIAVFTVLGAMVDRMVDL